MFIIRRCFRIKIGVLTDKPDPVECFDFTSYYVKSCTGRINKPAKNILNIITCFGDNRTARKRPEWVATSEFGKATRQNKYDGFLWDHICPNVKEYKTTLLNLIQDTSKTQISGIRLDCIGFPGPKYCQCQQCTTLYKKTQMDWIEWKSKIVKDFISEASKIVKENKKTFSVTLQPDPYFGKERYGEDVPSLEKHVDYFIVPIYDMSYSTTYWVKTLVYAFGKQTKKPLYIELYAANPGPKLKNLQAVITKISNHVDGIILATHNSEIAKEIRKNLTFY